MKRLVTRVGVTLVFLTLILQLVACGGVQVNATAPSSTSSSAGKSGPLKIAVVPKAIGFSYWESVHQGAECAASKLSNVTVQWNGVTAETDVTGQVNLLTNYITQGVNGLVYAATDAKALAQVTSQAMNTGVKVVNIDSGTTPQPANVPLFATDNVASAGKVADLLSQALNGKGKVAFLPFLAGSATNDERAQGFLNGLKNHPGLDLVATQYTQSDTNKALQETEDILSAHPDLNGIFAANEPGVIGAAEAVKRAGKAGKVVIIGWDAAPDELTAVKQGEISALVVQNPFKMGYDGVNAVVKEVRDGAQVQNEDTGVSFVTPQNLNDPKTQAVLNSSCTNPPV
jgi:ribose transport system substrate-binding protein